MSAINLGRAAQAGKQKPEDTVTIRVTPDHRLFTPAGSRQATAPARQPAMHIKPSQEMEGVDPHRTQAMIRRTAHAAKSGEVEPAVKPVDSHPTPILEHAPTDDSRKEQKTVELHPGMDTLVMPANSDTIPDTAWRCPHCASPNRHQGVGVDMPVTCTTCGEHTVLTPDIISPLETRVVEKDYVSGINALKGRSFLGKYTLDRFLGRGGMGEVWLGRHPNLDIPVAIKIMSSDLMARNPTYLERFLSEARTAAQMNHPNVVRIYDADHHDGLYFIVLEYMNGGDVLQLARRNGGKLPPSEALRVIVAVTDALHEAARFNIIHRDIKPENIMLTRDGQIKLADLGIAKRIHSGQEAEHFTFTNMILGTPAYIAPEQALNASEVDLRADIYSLGATFYQLVTGSIPFPAKSPFQMMYKHVKEPLVNPRERNPDLPDNICAVICKMMEKDPIDRYQDMQTLLADLCRIRDRDAPVMQLQLSQLPFATSTPAVPPTAQQQAAAADTDRLSIWRMAPVQLAIGAAIASLAVILGIQMMPEPVRDDGNASRELLRNVLLQVKRQSAESRQEANVNDPAIARNPADTTPPTPSPPVEGAPPDSAQQAVRPVVLPQPADVVPVVAQPPVETAPSVAAAEAARLREEMALDTAKRKQFDTRLAEAETVLKRVEAKNLPAAHGVGQALLEAEHALADAKTAAAGRQWEPAAVFLDKAVTQSLRAETIDRDRKAANNLMDELTASRRAAVAAGASELATLAPPWKDAEAAYTACENAMQTGEFRPVSLKAAELQGQFRHLETQAPAIRTRTAAAAAFQRAYDAADLNLLQAWGREDLTDIETKRRLAEAETIDHAAAAAGFMKAEELLTAALKAATARRQLQQQEAKSAAAAAARSAAEVEAEAKWLKISEELQKMHASILSAAAEPRMAAVALMRAKELDNRMAAAEAASRTDKDREWLKSLATATADLNNRLARAPQPGVAWLIPELEIELLPVNKGTYNRGSTGGAQDEQPEHPVTISHGFWMGRFEITQEQYGAITNTTPSGITSRPHLPVETISWDLAMSYCRQLNDREGRAGRLVPGYEYRLPTEAEWEYVCRAGTVSQFSFGDDAGELFRYGNYCDRAFRGISSWRDTDHDDRFDKTAPIGSFIANTWGFQDMHGNVAEWCLDRYNRYGKSALTDPIGSGGRGERVFRGGSWTGAASLCRSSQRSAAAPSYATNGLGFRIVLAPIVIIEEERGGIGRLLSP